MSLKETFQRELGNTLKRFVKNHAQATQETVEQWTVEYIQKRGMI